MEKAVSVEGLYIDGVSKDELKEMLKLMAEFHTKDGESYWYEETPLINAGNIKQVVRSVIGIVLAGLLIAVIRIIGAK